MSARKASTSRAPTAADGMAALLTQYGCGPIPFAAADQGLYDRHLLFDNVVDPAAAGARERFEAFARTIAEYASEIWNAAPCPIE